MGKMGRISPKLKRIHHSSKFAHALATPDDPIIGCFKQSVIASELRRYKGAVSSAAKSLGIAKKTLEKYIMKSKVLKDIVCEITETEIDFVEGKLHELIDSKNLPAILFYLKCKGRDRGWIEKNDLSVEVKPITFKYNLAKGGQNAAKRSAKENT